VGRKAAGVIAVGQFVFGYYTFARFGFGEHVWSTGDADPVAVDFYENLFSRVKGFSGG
jgi:hypothetical protein